MSIKVKIVVFLLVIIDVISILFVVLHNKTFAVLNPIGVTALAERNLILFVSALLLSVVIPVVLLTFYMAWHYRIDNKKAKYTPDWESSRTIEFARLALLLAVIGTLGVVTWSAAHSLDPWKPLSAKTKALEIDVVALQWRWLFIYPAQHIATINYLQIPEKTPITFMLTADAPMNSFWIPQLGGQMYAMAGMVTQDHMMVNHTGTFIGRDAEISGRGFARMKFTVSAVSQKDFRTWIGTLKNSQNTLSFNTYIGLGRPSTDETVKYFTVNDANLYNKIVVQSMLVPTKH